jgi:SAM-dependent methyltransferase
MSAEVKSDPTAAPALSADPNDLLAEGARARKLAAEVEGVKSLLEGTRLVNDMVLGQVLFALWDSGFYEYSLSHRSFGAQEAADELNLDASILSWLLDYLMGRGMLRSADGRMELTEHGIRLSNVLLRGTMNLYIGGWGPQLASIGPLLRKEVSQDQFKTLRSGRHTVMGTEQLACVRTVPAVLKILTRTKLLRVLHVASRNGQFLIELARSEPALQGVGVEKDANRTAAAEANAAGYGVQDRLRFITAEFGQQRLPLDDRSLGEIDVVTALYLLHEVARHGRHAVVELLGQIKSLVPGRRLLFMETLPGVPHQGKKPPATFSQLDYLLIHRLRGQGLPLPSAEWKSILEEAGLKLLEFHEVYWSGLYLVEL